MEDGLALVQTLLADDMAERNRLFASQIRQLKAHLVKENMWSSSVAVTQMQNIAIDEFRVRQSLILQTWQRVLSSLESDTSLLPQAAENVAQALAGERDYLENIVTSQTVGGLTNPAGFLDGVCSLATKSLQAELSLSEAKPRQAQSPSSPLDKSIEIQTLESTMVTPPLVKEIPTAFVSYSWDSDAHKGWVAALSARLRADGVDVMLDDWHTRLGDQLPHFMESAIRKNDFILIVCTPQYKQKSEARVGGVGYEGNIITAELSLHGKERKFIPILRAGDWHEAAPNWLLGKKACDLRGEPYSEREYSTLLDTLHGVVLDPPPVGPQRSSVAIQSLDSVAVTQQSKYAELVNAAIRAHQAAKNRIILIKDGSTAARTMLPQADKDMENFGRLVFELQQEMSLLSSEPVAKAASEIAGWVLAIRMNSHAPEREPELDAAFQSLIKTAIPNFREAVRRELAARGGTV